MLNLRGLRQLHHQFEITDRSDRFSQKMPEASGEDKCEELATQGTKSLRCQGKKLEMAVAKQAIALVALGMSSAIAFSKDCALAQITTDTTLGPAQPLNKDGQIYNIRPELGQTVGSNLFHSFGIFNLNQGEIADFQSSSAIRNILARVTGGNPSVINGQIFTSSAGVNLFFINPYGIIFGPNASLDVGGRSARSAFVATTVDALVWPDGKRFSAINPEGRDSLLTIVGDPGGFLSSSKTPGLIANYGGNLSVYNNQSLLLLGGTVTLDGGTLEAEGGRIEIGAVGGAGKVDLEVRSNDLSLKFPEDLARADISITNGALLNAVTGQDNGVGIGNIRILGRNIVINNGTQLDVSSVGQADAGIAILDATESVAIAGEGTAIFSRVESGAQGDAGGIGIKARSFSLTDGAQLTTSTFGIGNTGVVAIQADQVLIDNSQVFSAVRPGAQGDALGILIEAKSITLNNQAKLETVTESQGDAGLVSLQTNGGSVALDNSRIFSTVESGGDGNGGRIEIETGSLSLNNGAQLQTIVRGGGIGDPGIIYVEAADSVSLAGISPTDGNPSGIFSVIDQNAQGGFGSSQFAGGIFDAIITDSGDNIVGAIGIDTGSLSLTDGAQLNTSTDGRGNAGAVLVLARDEVSLKNGGAILSAAGTNAQGSSGAILLGVGSLSIDGTSGVPTGLTTQTDGNGDAGLIFVAADRDISLKGQGSGIFSTIEQTATGDSGGVLISARDLYIKDGAELSVSNNNPSSGTAGDIYLTTRDVRLEDGGKITATTLSGDGGNISIEARDLLVLTNTSNISTQAGRADAGGNGGNIAIKTQYIFAAPVKDSNIVAQAYTGNGGSIGVTAAQLYKIAPRPEVKLTNDIDASSQYGQDGLVTTNVLNVDPTQGLNSLSENPVDPSRLIAQQCAARSRDSGQENKFVVIGRGGLPTNPNNTLQNESVVTDWVGEPPQENPSENNHSANPERSFSTATNSAKPSELVEAQGWVIGEKGEIILTANAPTAIPHDPKLTPAASCHGS